MLLDNGSSKTMTLMSRSGTTDYMKFNVAGTGYASGTPAIFATDYDGVSDDIKVIMTPRGASDDGMIGTLSNHPLQIVTNEISRIGITAGGSVYLPQLSGTGTRCVNATSTGVLEAGTIPCGSGFITSAWPPVACAGGTEGRAYMDTDLHLPCVCNATNWVQMDDFSTTCSTSTTTTVTTTTTAAPTTTTT